VEFDQGHSAHTRKSALSHDHKSRQPSLRSDSTPRANSVGALDEGRAEVLGTTVHLARYPWVGAALSKRSHTPLARRARRSGRFFAFGSMASLPPSSAVSPQPAIRIAAADLTINVQSEAIVARQRQPIAPNVQDHGAPSPTSCSLDPPAL